jgi:hypothetical protein
MPGCFAECLGVLYDEAHEGSGTLLNDNIFVEQHLCSLSAGRARLSLALCAASVLLLAG